MARAIWLPGGGGADLDVVTADAGDVLAGKVIVGPDGEPLTGTLALSGNASDGQVLSGQTYYNTDAKTKRTGTMPNRGAVNQSLAINGSYTIPAGYHNGSGKVTQNVPTKGAQTYTPGTTNQTIAASQWLTGAQTILGDANLKPENIKKGVSIFGKMGIFEGLVSSPYYLWKRGSLMNGQTLTFGSASDEIVGSYIVVYIGTKFNKFVDLTNHKFLKFVGASHYERRIEIRVNILTTSGSLVATASATTSSNEATGFVDISALNGQYQISLYGGIRSGIKDTARYYEVFLSNE